MITTVRGLARQERAAFADLLDELTPEQWSAPTLCAGWTVRDVAAHVLAYLDQSRIGLAMAMLRSRLDVDRLNDRAFEAYATLEPEQLTSLMRQGIEPSGAGALYGGRVALIECVVHQQDIRRPLALPRTIAPQQLQATLNYARISPVIGGARQTRGVRLIATDLDWSAGRGPEIHGSAEALLLAMTGRFAAVRDELDGPGVALLAG